MAFDQAIIIALLGSAFYFAYLATTLDNKHQILRVGLLLISWLSMLILLATAHSIALNDVLTNSDIDNLLQLAYTTMVYLTFGFFAYWIIFLAGGWWKTWTDAEKHAQ